MIESLLVRRKLWKTCDSFGYQSSCITSYGILAAETLNMVCVQHKYMLPLFFRAEISSMFSADSRFEKSPLTTWSCCDQIRCRNLLKRRDNHHVCTRLSKRFCNISVRVHLHRRFHVIEAVQFVVVIRYS